MKMYITAIRDIATDSYAPPYFSKAKGEAIRMFTDAVNDDNKDNMLNRHPEHFELYTMGTYDTDTGKIEAKDPEQILTAAEALNRKQ